MASAGALRRWLPADGAAREQGSGGFDRWFAAITAWAMGQAIGWARDLTGYIALLRQGVSPRRLGAPEMSAMVRRCRGYAAGTKLQKFA